METNTTQPSEESCQLEFAELVFNGIRPLEAINMVLTPIPWVAPQLHYEIMCRWQTSKVVRDEITRLEKIVPTNIDLALMCLKLARHPQCSDENRTKFIRLGGELLKYLGSGGKAADAKGTDDPGHMYEVFDALKSDFKDLEEKAANGTK